MQKHKKVLSLILAMVLALSCFSCLGSVSAFAAETQQLQIGDANADGVIDIDDADGNSVCDISDVTAIQQYCADIIREQLRLGNTFAEHHKGHAIGAVSRTKGQLRHVYQRVHQSGISVPEHMTDGTRKGSVFCLC